MSTESIRERLQYILRLALDQSELSVKVAEEADGYEVFDYMDSMIYGLYRANGEISVTECRYIPAVMYFSDGSGQPEDMEEIPITTVKDYNLGMQAILHHRATCELESFMIEYDFAQFAEEEKRELVVV